MLSLFSFLLLFLIITLVHELGHLIMAKKAGIRVYEFSIGLGPKIFSIIKSKTEYSLRIIPVGGFVRIAGMGEDKEDAACPTEEQYQYKNPWKKFYSIAAGATMNLLLAMVIFFFVFSVQGIPSGVTNEIASIEPNSEAATIGLRPGDKIIALNGKVIENMEKTIEIIHKSQNISLKLTLLRGEENIALLAIPKYNEKLKVSLIGFSPKVIYKKYNVFKAFWAGFVQTIGMAGLIAYFLGQLIIGKVSFSGVAGPLGIAQMSGEYASQGFWAFARFLAFFNINVAVLNLLPIPALDGGRLVFVVLEAIRRKPISIEKENQVHQVGLVVLLGLLALVTGNDLIKMFIAKP